MATDEAEEDGGRIMTVLDPRLMDWTQQDDVVVALAAEDGIPQAKTEQERRRAAAAKQSSRVVPDAKRPRPLTY
jgi:hypothetical protein